MADIKTQQAFDRIAIKTKELNNNRKQEHTQSTAEIAALKNDLENVRKTTEMLADKSKYKQLTKGEDWNTFEELLPKIDLYDDVNIVVTTTIYITGVISFKTNDYFDIKGILIDSWGCLWIGKFKVEKSTDALQVTITPGANTKKVEEIRTEVRKDISDIYQTRSWTEADNGKNIDIQYLDGSTRRWCSGKLNVYSSGRIAIDLGTLFVENNKMAKAVYDSVNGVNKLTRIDFFNVQEDNDNIDILNNFYAITGFFIWE